MLYSCHTHIELCLIVMNTRCNTMRFKTGSVLQAIKVKEIMRCGVVLKYYGAVIVS